MDLQQKLISSFDNFINAQDKSLHLKNLRTSALETFSEQGFPTKKQEAWKYTSLNPILKEDYSFNIEADTEISKQEISKYLLDTESYQLVFVNGVFQSKLSDTIEENIVVISLSEAFSNDTYRTVIEKHFSHIAQKEEAMTTLNTAFFNEGSFIYVKKGKAIEKPVQILYLSTELENPLFTQPRNLVIIEENAEVKIIERHQNSSSQKVLTNVVTEIFSDKHSFVDYYKIENDSQNSSLIDNTYALQKEKSHASVHTFSFGGDITRNNLNFYQKGEYMESTLKGITILEDRQHVDHYTLVNHEEPNCESHQDYKSILSGRSTNAFNGKIMVEKIAQKTNAYQQNDNILLSDKATVYTKPQLEIFADDVRCSHGCTIGQLDSDAIFYLQSRGIPKKEAEALLTYAFAHTVLSSVKIPALKTLIDMMIAQKLGVDKMGFDLE